MYDLLLGNRNFDVMRGRAACVSVLGGIQPGPLEGYLSLKRKALLLDRKNRSVRHGLMEREYRGWTIAVHSFEAEKGKWHPVVTVSL